MDSTIRLRQLNQPDLSGYISQVVFPALRTSGISVGGNILPTGSGIYNLGSTGLPYKEVYAKGIFLPSGSGVYFGNNFFTAYTSGTSAVVSVNGYTIVSTAQGVSIIGPSGATGATGNIGPTGVSGIGITGATSSSNSLILQLSNGTTLSPVPLPSGATGTSGISCTGFLPDGNFLIPQFSNGTTGNPFPVASGAQGPRGFVGGLTIDCDQMTGILTGQVPPQIKIYGVDTGTFTNPPLHLIRGMRYRIGQSGMNTARIYSTGEYGLPVGDIMTNLYKKEDDTSGYLRFTVFDKDFNTGNFTGRLVYPETTPYDFVNDVLPYIKDSEVMSETGDYILSMEFNLKYSTPYSEYKYGLMRYTLDGAIDTISPWGAYVLGTMYVDYYGPRGPAGPSGAMGLPGPAGETGPAGVNGLGVNVTGVVYTDMNHIAFGLSDGSMTNAIEVPVSGPIGPAGLTGPQGLSGERGLQGPVGMDGTGDKYKCSFAYNTVNISGLPEWSIYIRSGASWHYATGNDSGYFKTGDTVRFQHDTLVGKAYSPWQKVLVSNNDYYAATYFYATVEDYDTYNGVISLHMTDSPSPAGLVDGNMYWSSLGMVNLNLGGLGSQGPVGGTGAQGPKGDTGNSIFTVSDVYNLDEEASPFVINPAPTDAWRLVISGSYDYQIDFDLGGFSVGQVVQVRVTNSGTQRNDEVNLIVWDTNVAFPYGAPAPAPNPNETCLYTFVRYPEKIFCTYSTRYVI